MFRILLFILFCCLAALPVCAQVFQIKKDLSSDWFFYNNDGKIDTVKTRGLKSIHFRVNVNQFPGDQLSIRSHRPYFVFANGKLIADKTGGSKLNLDSLAKSIKSSVITFSIFQERIRQSDLQTVILSSTKHKGAVTDIKPSSYFRDFISVAGLILIIFFVALTHGNPKLASEYLSTARMLSLREAQDNQAHARFAISSNILFYIFSSLLLALCLITIFQNMPDSFLLGKQFTADTFWLSMYQWLKLSFILVSIFFIKVMLISGLATLFGFSGIAGVHFFNWTRLILLLAGIFSLIVYVYHIRSGANPEFYKWLLIIMISVTTAWIVLIFLKLNNRVEHSLFHLFSYICATEIIPLLITIKVLFN